MSSFLPTHHRAGVVGDLHLSLAHAQVGGLGGFRDPELSAPHPHGGVAGFDVDLALVLGFHK